MDTAITNPVAVGTVIVTNFVPVAVNTIPIPLDYKYLPIDNWDIVADLPLTYDVQYMIHSLVYDSNLYLPVFSLNNPLQFLQFTVHDTFDRDYIVNGTATCLSIDHLPIYSIDPLSFAYTSEWPLDSCIFFYNPTADIIGREK